MLTKAGKLEGFPSNSAIFSSNRKIAHSVIRNLQLVYAHLFIGDHCAFVPIIAKEGKIIVRSTYTVPSPEFGTSVEEWQHLFTHRNAFICGVDFNANSTLWCCSYEDLRGEFLTQHFVAHNLAIENLHNTKATFVKLNSQSQRLAGSDDSQSTNFRAGMCV